MSRVMSEWYRRNTSVASDWPLARVLELKGEARIAVVIPARNEAATVGEVVSMISAELGGLVDELIVMDSLSTDGTADVARQSGATVHAVTDVRPDLGGLVGKGEALWKSQFVTTSDLLVFIDADLTEWGTHFVTGLLGPMLADPKVALVRGFYDRVFDDGSTPTMEGGRVTELVARPWLALHRPHLSEIVQPLAGEWAIRRSAFELLSVPVGYGVELSTLLDVDALFGLEGIAQVDLGRRAHKHQSLHDLSAMATEILAVGDRRLESLRSQSIAIVDPATGDRDIVALRWLTPERSWREREVSVDERPPAVTVDGSSSSPSTP